MDKRLRTEQGIAKAIQPEIIDQYLVNEVEEKENKASKLAYHLANKAAKEVVAKRNRRRRVESLEDLLK